MEINSYYWHILLYLWTLNISTNIFVHSKRINSSLILSIPVSLLHSRADAIRLAADVTRLALEMLFVLTVGPKAQMALCEEVQLPSGEQQKGMRYDLREEN